MPCFKKYFSIGIDMSFTQQFMKMFHFSDQGRKWLWWSDVLLSLYKMMVRIKYYGHIILHTHHNEMKKVMVLKKKSVIVFLLNLGFLIPLFQQL